MFSNIISTSRSNIKFHERPQSVLGEIKKPKTHPWQVLDYSPEKEQAIYVGWGRHCFWQQQMRLAENYFNRALEIQHRDPKALYSRSICKRSLAQPMEAFEDSLRATYLEPLKHKYNWEFCYTLFELNEFEMALAEVKNIMRNCSGPYQKRFDELSGVFSENLKTILGESAGYFFIRHGKFCCEVFQEFKRNNTIDTRPTWKILKEKDECDVESLRIKKGELVSPLEMARRKRATKVFLQKYLQRSWTDVLTLRKFPKLDILLPRAFKDSTPKLRELLTTQNNAIRKFAKMLHARHPLYCDLDDKMKRKKLWDRCHESNLFMVQYTTRRHMFLILRAIRHLRSTGDIEKLSQYVEKAMSECIVEKTDRILPWKFEFMSDVYNLLALAYTDFCVVPPGFDATERDALEKLFCLPTPTDYVMNTKDNWSIKPKEKSENALKNFKAFLKHMEKRLLFSKHAIEKAYIYHEIARAQFKNNYFNDSASVAQKGFQEADNCNHSLYGYLCTILAARSLVSNFKIDKSLLEVTKAQNFANVLGCEQLIEYTDLVKLLVETKIAEQKTSHSGFDKKKKSLSGNSSRESTKSADFISSDQRIGGSTISDSSK